MKELDQYNQETRTVISQVYQDLNQIFPNLFTEEEYLERILSALKGNIVFHATLPNKTAGLYHKGIVSVANCSNIAQDEIVFHEFTHVLNYNQLSFASKTQISKEMIEIFTTLIEEKYRALKREYKRRDRINGYIPDFGHQLLAIYGNDILRTFLKSPDELYKMMAVITDCPPYLTDRFQQSNWNNLNRGITNITYMVMAGEDDASIITEAKKLEASIFDHLAYLLEQKKLPDVRPKLETLFQLQYYPNFASYAKEMKRLTERGILTPGEIQHSKPLSFILMIENATTEEIVEQIKDGFYSEKELEYLAQRIFGFDYYMNIENLYYETPNDEIELDELVEISTLSELPSGLSQFYEAQEHFISNITIYKTLVKLLTYRDITFPELKDLAMKKQERKVHNYDFQRELKHGKRIGRIMSLTEDKDSQVITFVDPEHQIKILLQDEIVYQLKSVAEMEDAAKKSGLTQIEALMCCFPQDKPIFVADDYALLMNDMKEENALPFTFFYQATMNNVQCVNIYYDEQGHPKAVEDTIPLEKVEVPLMAPVLYPKGKSK